MIRLGLCILRRTQIYSLCHSHHISSQCHLLLLMLVLVPWLQTCSASFSPFMLQSLEDTHCVQPVPNEQGDRLHELLKILLHQQFVYSPHLFIYSIMYLCQYVLMVIYFILCIISQYYFILVFKLSQLQPQGAVSIVPHVPLTCMPIIFCFYLIISSLSGTTRCSKLLYFWLKPRISPFSKASWFLLLENSIRSQLLHARCVHCF